MNRRASAEAEAAKALQESERDEVEVECACGRECPSYSMKRAATCHLVNANSEMPTELEGVMWSRLEIGEDVSSLLYRLYMGLTEKRVTYLTYECPACMHRTYFIEHLDVIDGLVLELAHRGDDCGWE